MPVQCTNGEGFCLIANVASLSDKSVIALQGAAFLTKLRRPVTLGLKIRKPSNVEGEDQTRRRTLSICRWTVEEWQTSDVDNMFVKRNVDTSVDGP